MDTMFSRLPTETTGTTTTNSISYKKERDLIEVKSFVFFNGIAF
ncbi:hypothetical protein [Prochlorococcus marinus]|nr:hypothetical protein [Prochlorococcus marinus]